MQKIATTTAEEVNHSCANTKLYFQSALHKNEGQLHYHADGSHAYVHKLSPSSIYVSLACSIPL